MALEIDWTNVGIAVGSLLSGAGIVYRRVGSTKSAAKEGAAEGAATTLNGTAATVRRIEALVGTMGGKLDDHIAETQRRFDDLGGTIADTREDLATLKGQLHPNTPIPSKAKPKRKPVRRR